MSAAAAQRGSHVCALPPWVPARTRRFNGVGSATSDHRRHHRSRCRMAGSSDETAGHHTNASSTLHIHPDKTQIGTARRFVQQTLGTWGLSTQTAELQVAASELVTNAIMHGQGAVDVTLMHLA